MDPVLGVRTADIGIKDGYVAGIDNYVGSLEPGKLADIVLWDPAFFGLKPDVVLKSGFPAYSAMGEANGSLTTDDFVLNSYCPSIDVDPETFVVTVDGDRVSCDPAETVPLAQRYTL